MAKTRGNNGKDFEAVFDQHFEQVYGYVAYRLAPDTHAAGDVTQETFLAALKGWESFRGEGSVLTWLRSIARRKTVDYFRRQGRLAETPLTAPPVAVDQTNPAAQRALFIATVMQSLPNGQAELLEDKYLEGLSVREMASRRDTSEQAIASALFRARQTFRDQYERLQSRQEA